MATDGKKKRRTNTSGLKPFKKGQSGNPNGRPKLTKKAKEIRKMNRSTLAELLHKYSAKTIDDLKSLRRDTKNVPALDMIVIVNLVSALEKENANSRDFIIERIAGKVPNDVKLESTLEVKTINEQIAEDIELLESDDWED